MLNKQEKEILARIFEYVLNTEEQHYEETCSTYGEESDIARAHIYELVRVAKCMFETDL